MKYYLKTLNACNLYTIEIVPCKKELDDSKCIIFDESQIETFKELVFEIQNRMRIFWQEKGCEKDIDFDTDKEYSYVTTSYSSHLKKLKVIRNLIKRKENTVTCRYNYFKNECDAKELCECLKEILKKYGIL